MEEKLKKFILSGVIGDTLNYKNYVNNLGGNVEYKGQWSYITELMILTTKSLMPCENEVGCKIDYLRFLEELKLWEYYKHGDNELISNSYKETKNDSYFKGQDKSISSRIFPIIASNVNWEIARREVIKNILYSSGNIKTILEYLVLSKLVFIILNDKNMDYDKLLENIKEEVINFSQIDFINEHSEDFKYDINNYNGIFKIDFEKERITLLNLLSGIHKEGSFDILNQVLDILKNDKETHEYKDYDFLSWGVKGLIRDTENNNEIKDRAFLESLGNYIYKIRKGRITPESLRIKKYDLPDVFNFKVNEEFSHSLLNKGKILSKEDKGKYIITYIKTKSGIYRFFKIKK